MWLRRDPQAAPEDLSRPATRRMRGIHEATVTNLSPERHPPQQLITASHLIALFQKIIKAFAVRCEGVECCSILSLLVCTLLVSTHGLATASSKAKPRRVDLLYALGNCYTTCRSTCAAVKVRSKARSSSRFAMTCLSHLLTASDTVTGYRT